MNPWHTNILQKLQNGIRFALWAALAVNCGIACFFSILFTYQLFSFGWQWCRDHLFSAPW